MWNKELDILEVDYACLEAACEEVLIDSTRKFLKSGFPADLIAENLNLPLWASFTDPEQFNRKCLTNITPLDYFLSPVFAGFLVFEECIYTQKIYLFEVFLSLFLVADSDCGTH